jgi:SAM-dependent methyltransferase
VSGFRQPWMDDLLEELVHGPIRTDKRTRENPGTYLGWPSDRIFAEVIEYGQADFDTAKGHLSGDDRALLYARFNMGRHLDELGEAFSKLFADASRMGKPTILDLGCGPFTAGLALSGALGPGRSFRYYGIDRATSMCALGARFAAGARTRGQLHPQTSLVFGSDLQAVDFGPICGTATIAVASYLLASSTIDVDQLVQSMLDAFNRIGPGPVAVLYTNSAHPIPNKKYPEFRERLLAAGFELRVDATELFAKTRNPKELKYALLSRSATLTLPLSSS